MEIYKSLRKRDKILKRYEYKEIYNKGKKISIDGLFTLYILKEGNSPPRIGIAVPKNVGGAVVRNRIKRIFREIFRLNKRSIIEGSDIVIVARKGLKKVRFRYRVIEDLFLKALEKGHYVEKGVMLRGMEKEDDKVSPFDSYKILSGVCISIFFSCMPILS
ncbi:MAG: ribonuclease P protein component [Nitrospinae bacterium]|nr:ribonuclease P protein component [Nitrospinota bacterium]